MVLLYVTLIPSCKQNLQPNKYTTQKYQDFDKICELLVKCYRSPDCLNEADLLLKSYLNNLQLNQERDIYFIAGCIKTLKVERDTNDLLKKRGILEDDLFDEMKLSNPWFYEELKEKMNDVYQYFTLATEYKPSEIEATIELFFIAIEQYMIEPTSEVKEKLKFYASRLTELLKYSRNNHLIKWWVQNKLQLTTDTPTVRFDVYRFFDSLLESWRLDISDDVRMKAELEKEVYSQQEIISNVDLFKKADVMFLKKNFDEAIIFYKYSGHWTIDHFAGPYYNDWTTKDGDKLTDDNYEKWSRISLASLAFNKVAECYQEKVKLVDNVKNLSEESKKSAKIEYYKSAIFNYWLAILRNDDLIEPNKKIIIELRQKIKEIESQLHSESFVPQDKTGV